MRLAPKIEVAVDEEFQLAKEETARVRELNLLVTVTELFYTRCLAGAMCVRADGPGAVFEVRDADSGKVALRGNDSAAAPSHFPVRALHHFRRQDVRPAVRAPHSRLVPSTNNTDEAPRCWQRTAELARDTAHCTHIAGAQARAARAHFTT